MVSASGWVGSSNGASPEWRSPPPPHSDAICLPQIPNPISTVQNYDPKTRDSRGPKTLWKYVDKEQQCEPTYSLWGVFKFWQGHFHCCSWYHQQMRSIRLVAVISRLYAAVDVALTCESCYAAIPSGGVYISYSVKDLRLQELNLRWAASYWSFLQCMAPNTTYTPRSYPTGNRSTIEPLTHRAEWTWA